jgi:hypothetical protein
LLGLAVACVPAHANPTNKNITLSCNITAGSDVITGDVTTMNLCAPSTPPCSAEIFACPSIPIYCASNGANNDPVSITVPCDAPWKVGGFQAQIDATSFLSNGTLIGSGGKDLNTTLGGKGYSVTFSTSPGSANDTVTFTVK